MRISIIIPVYNAEQYLHRSLDSIIAQSFTEWECIIVDDGSTDRSGSICDEYASKDSRFHVIHKQNEGVSIARNTGIDCSKGEYIVFLDADDFFANSFIDKMINVSDCSLVVCAYQEIGCRDIIKGPNKFEEIRVDKGLPVRWNKTYSPYWLYIWGKLFKSEIIKSNSIYFDTDMRYLEDFCFVLKYMCCIENIILINDVLIYHIRESNKYSKYIMNFDELDKHMQKNDTCFCLLEDKCGFSKFTGMRTGIAYRHFFNFYNYIKSSDVCITKKIIEVQKYKEQGRNGLYEYVKIPNIKIKLFWKLINIFVSIFSKKVITKY